MKKGTIIFCFILTVLFVLQTVLNALPYIGAFFPVTFSAQNPTITGFIFAPLSHGSLNHFISNIVIILSFGYLFEVRMNTSTIHSLSIYMFVSMFSFISLFATDYLVELEINALGSSGFAFFLMGFVLWDIFSDVLSEERSYFVVLGILIVFEGISTLFFNGTLIDQLPVIVGHIFAYSILVPIYILVRRR